MPARISGGSFSVSSDWIPFVKEKNSSGNITRKEIKNGGHLLVASVLKEMKKAGPYIMTCKAIASHTSVERVGLMLEKSTPKKSSS